MKKKKLFRCIPLLLCCCLLLQPLAAFAASLGDADGNGEISAADARLALRAAVGLEQYAPGSDSYLACDANCDGEITAADARLILRAAVGLETLSGKTLAGAPYIWTLKGSLVPMDNNDVKVYMDSYMTSPEGLSLEFYCHSKLSDNTPIVLIDDVSLNGYMIPVQLEMDPDPFSTELTHGSLLVPSHYLTYYGDPADEISFVVYLYYSGMEDDGPQASNHVTVYPTGKTAATVSYRDRYEGEEEDVLCSTGQTEIVYRGATAFPGENVLLYLDFYLENRSDRDQYYVFYIHEVNGEETDFPMSVSVTAGKRADAGVILYADETGIPDGTEITSVGMTVAVFSSDGTMLFQTEF